MFRKQLSALFIGLTFLVWSLNAQAQNPEPPTTANTEIQKPQFSYHRMHLLPMDSMPVKVKITKGRSEIPEMIPPTPNPVIHGTQPTEPGSTNFQPDGEDHATNKISGIPVQVGRNFEGNHLFRWYPADNAIAISDGGTIVSIDNASIAYFNEDGDSTVQFGLPHPAVFGNLAGLGNGVIFDPRVIYDREADRFISAMLYHSADYTDSKLLVSFSLPLLTDSVSWYHFAFDCDTLFTDPSDSLLWFDFPHIGQNHDEVFVSVNTYEYDPVMGQSSFRGNSVFQIDKSTSYNGVPNSVYRHWANIQNTDTNTNSQPVPLSDAYQATTYDSVFYFVGNYSTNSAEFFWWELKGDLNDPNATWVKHGTSTSFFYSVPSYASQLGGLGTDRIKFGSNKIHSGFFQNGKLHFVFHRSDNGWGELVYANIDISTNTFSAHTYGGDGTNMNYMYPSIAPFGNDSTKENYLIAFQRTGPGIYPELCVVNYENGWSSSTTVVKQGEGILDLSPDLISPWDSLERIGDYTDIQRRFNSPVGACWLAGSYPFGDTLNHFGERFGMNTWIAEVGDSSVTGISQRDENKRFTLFPNPVSSNQSIRIELPAYATQGQLEIWSIEGKKVFQRDFSGKSLQIDNIHLPSSVYFVRVSDKMIYYETKKVIFLP